MEKNYNEIKQNLINNFFNKGYKNTIADKKIIISDMQDRCPFEIKMNEDDSTMEMILGNGINLIFNLDWQERFTLKAEGINKLVKHPCYKLISIY